jgi:hypothetical protein
LQNIFCYHFSFITIPFKIMAACGISAMRPQSH